MAELCLGTVQFGMNYGINNSSGQPAEENVFEMLDTAIEHGIRVFDTAPAYGTSEILLGKYLKARKTKDPVRIVSKLRPNLLKDHEKDTAGAIRRELENTLERLQTDRLDGYLLHDAQDFYFPGVPDALRRLKEEKLAEHVGLSIYELGTDMPLWIRMEWIMSSFHTACWTSAECRKASFRMQCPRE